MEEKTLVLEICKKKDILDYQKTLYEAAVLGIAHVVFVIKVDEIAKCSKNINFIMSVIHMTCDIFNIRSSSNTVTIYGDFIGDSVGIIDGQGNIKNFGSLLKFSAYKKKRENRDILSSAESFKKVYDKKLKI